MSALCTLHFWGLILNDNEVENDVHFIFLKELNLFIISYWNHSDAFEAKKNKIFALMQIFLGKTGKSTR